eukprot:566542-Pyramimonas_sp.AAC.1
MRAFPYPGDRSTVHTTAWHAQASGPAECVRRNVHVLKPSFHPTFPLHRAILDTAPSIHYRNGASPGWASVDRWSV